MSDHPKDRHDSNTVETRHPVLEAAESVSGPTDDIVTLSTGIRVRLKPVAPSLIADISGSVEYPSVPLFTDESGREMENPMHPDYIRDIDAADAKRASLVMEAMVMFAFELVDGLPEDETWLRKIEILSRRGGADLTGLDVDNPLDQEFLYKKYIAVGQEDIRLAGTVTGIRSEDVEAASDSFPSN
jgi:hypothetical protein